MNIDQNYIDYFEKNLNTVEPDKSSVPFKILGYGEISSIFRMDEYPDVVFKRIPVFPHDENAELYRKQYFEYTSHLKKAGINLPWENVFITRNKGPYILYLAQHIFKPDLFCNKLIHTFDDEEITVMVKDIISTVSKVRIYNKKNMPGIEIAIDAQLSNWTYPLENGKRKLYLVDTSTPFYRVDGCEQLDVNLLLKSMPFIIRLFVKFINLDDVVARYYDFSTLFLDIIGNLIKEQASDKIPLLIEIVNRRISEDFQIKPVTRKDVESYYRSDKMIWIAFSALRRMDRFVTSKIMRKKYEFLLPGKVKR